VLKRFKEKCFKLLKAIKKFYKRESISFLWALWRSRLQIKNQKL